jgi:hypothetical protein
MARKKSIEISKRRPIILRNVLKVKEASTNARMGCGLPR